MHSSVSYSSTLIVNPKNAVARLSYLDGLRGLAALYVVLYHTHEQFKPGAPLESHFSHLAAFLTGWMEQGHLGVDVFIVLSGYCLMLPVARSADGMLKGGVWAYLKRRARRIVPPYYAALLISFIPFFLVQAQSGGVGAMTSDWRYNFAAIPILSHLLLVHNLFPTTAYQYDPPMWSVSTEWEIYFIFPVLLLIIRRAGIWVSVLTAAVLGILPHYLLPERFNLDWAYPWLLGLFGLGMLGAAISVSPQIRLKGLRERLPWGIVALVLVVPGFLLAMSSPKPNWFSDFLVGAGTAFFLVSCHKASMSPDGARPHLLLRLLLRWRNHPDRPSFHSNCKDLCNYGQRRNRNQGDFA